MKLYDAARSGNCHKIRMLLAQLKVPHDIVSVDLAQGGSKTPEFLRLNPRGQVPVLEDAGEIIWDSQAILIYLARKYQADAWLPTEPLAMARVMQWMAVAENEILYGIARARAAINFGAPWNVPECQALGKQALELLDAHLKQSLWLAADHPTLADIACYPYVAMAKEAGLALEDYAAVVSWIRRVQAWPGYVGMPGML